MPDVFLYSGNASPNDITLADPTIARPGTVTSIGDLTAPAGSWDAVAAERFNAAADLTAPAGAWVAIAAEAFAATSTLTAPTGAFAAAAAETIGSTGDITAPAGAIAAIGAERFDAVGALSAAAGVIDAVASEQFDIVADLSAPVGAWAASDSPDAIDCTGDWTAPAGDFEAAGEIAVVAGAPIVADVGGGVGGVGVGAVFVRQPKRQKPQPVPPVITATASWAAPVGQWQGRADVSTENIDQEEAYLLGLIDLEEAA